MANTDGKTSIVVEALAAARASTIKSAGTEKVKTLSHAGQIKAVGAQWIKGRHVAMKIGKHLRSLNNAGSLGFSEADLFAKGVNTTMSEIGIPVQEYINDLTNAKRVEEFLVKLYTLADVVELGFAELLGMQKDAAEGKSTTVVSERDLIGQQLIQAVVSGNKIEQKRLTEKLIELSK